MAFCTECGSKLPENALFCTNCGAKQGIYTDNTASKAPASSAEEEAEPKDNTHSSASVSEEPEQSEQSEQPKEQSGAQPLNYGGFIPPYQPGAYNFAPPPAPPLSPQKKRGDKTALIIILAVVAVIAAVFAFNYILGHKSTGAGFPGYWESEEIDFGNGSFIDEYFGRSVEGLMGLQINSDGSMYLGSAFYPDIISGSWTKSGSGISATLNGQAVYITFTGDNLLLNDGEIAVLFERSDGDINNPSTPFGSYPGGGQLKVPGSEENSAEENAGASVAGSGDVAGGMFHVSVVGAEPVKDTSGKPVVRVYYEFKNNFDFPVSAWDILDFEAYQDGSALPSANSWDDSVAEYYNSNLNIRPGVSILCFFEYSYNPDGGSIDFSVYGWDDGKSGGVVTATYVPGSFPGRPAPYVIKPISDPQWSLALPDSGTLDEYYLVAVKDAELTTDAYGDAAIRVFYEFTNNSNAAASLAGTLNCFTYQDGVQLGESYSIEDNSTDSLAYTEIQPGQTTSCSMLFKLRSSTSPVEAEVESSLTYAALGQTYSID